MIRINYVNFSIDSLIILMFKCLIDYDLPTFSAGYSVEFLLL